MIASSKIPHGPYRATKLWNEVISLFRSGMPVKKHRLRFKLHHDCFTGLDAVDWLHDLLKANSNFSANVTRKQTIQLLNKFLKNHVIEDIHGHFGEETFSDNGRLFRFPMNNSPIKGFQQPLSSDQSRGDPPKTYNSFSTSNSIALKDSTNHKNLEKMQFLKPKESDAFRNCLSSEQIWKTTFVACLMHILHIETDDDETIANIKINVDCLKRNSNTSDESGLVEVPCQDDMPCWVLSAMKCLSDWPDNIDTGLPNYEGFERDVFKAIVDYFQTLPEPLLTYDLLDVFTSILTRCEMLDQICDGHKHDFIPKNAFPKESSSNASDRIHKQLLQAQMRHENLAIRRQRSMNKRKKLFPDEAKQCSNFNENFRVHSIPIERSVSKQGGGMPSFSASIESLPEISVCDAEKRGSFECFNPRRQPIAFKSEGNLLAARENVGVDLEEMTENVFSSVEDLLLNMSANATELDTETGFEEQRNATSNYAIPLAESVNLRKENENQTFKSREWLMQLDGLSPKPLAEKKWQKNFSCEQPTTSKAAAVARRLTNAESAFSLYHNMADKSAVQVPIVDEYKTLPWHLNRRNSKVVTRTKRRKNSAAQAKRASWFGGDVQRSKSDIVARLEVPPTPKPSRGYEQGDASANHAAGEKLPHVSRTTARMMPRNEAAEQAVCYRRLSRSQSNIASQLKDGLPVSSLPSRPMSYHQSMDVLREASDLEKQSQSPLSVALERARLNLKAIASKQNKRSHSIEAFQLCLLLIPPESRRKLHLLLRLMTKMLANPNLAELDERFSTRELVIDRFTDSILRNSGPSNCVSRNRAERVVTRLLDNASVVTKINENLRMHVEEKLRTAEIEKAKLGKEVSGSFKPALKKQFVFCKQVSHSEYLSQNGKPLESALADLLQAIVTDQTISIKEKKKKLKQFQKSHPHIYNAQFPLGDPLTNEKKPRLGGAIQKLKNLRI